MSTYQRTYVDIENKISQLNASSTEVRSQLISEQKSHAESQTSSDNKAQILSLEVKVRELEGKFEDLRPNQMFQDSNVVGGEEPTQTSSSDPKETNSLRLELEQVKEDFNSKEYTIECMEKGKEATHEITSQKIDVLSSARLNLTEENSRLREIISKKDKEIAGLSSLLPPSMNDSSQKLPGWVSGDLRPLVYNHGLENKVMELDKSFARENILEALQELFSRDEMDSRSQTEILPN
ncbi:2311_t:CDS:2 [Acaulospora colombiana]|uniref:2311_t:CDS:1 n=1 Tax=Acaulospora colombiana TaxID=27376 RepID=A0ACA9JV79_9GLOM|nr:2311_t:CDS:2 [Acaulospora colombiana]